jgi:predicted enzyme related to lactoylglutathione lyase
MKWQSPFGEISRRTQQASDGKEGTTMRPFTSTLFAALVSVSLGTLPISPLPALADATDATGAQTATVGVGSQYDTTHVYVAPEDLGRFVASIVATFGGSSTAPSVSTITPTPSKATLQAALTPVGLISAFGFTTAIPYPFGAERTGYRVTDIDAAVKAARANGAAVVVAPFDDPIGRDVIIEWPGGVYMQFYRHTVAANAPPLATVPENRVYVSPDKADEFIRDFVAFSGGAVVSDDATAPGVEIGNPGSTYRRVRIASVFGKMTVLITDGHLSYPYGHETTGYDVANVALVLEKAKAAGATVLVPPYAADGREAAFVEFPGGFVAEIHAALK